MIDELLDAGLLHADIRCVHGGSLRAQAQEPWLDGTRSPGAPPAQSRDTSRAARHGRSFDAEGGLRRLAGNLGRAVVKVSAVKPEHRRIEAPARVFESQEALLEAFQAGALTGDFVAVIRAQGPRANGMPELHKLTPTLGVLQDRGQRVALLTDGRMSGASGKVLAAIHVVPEAACAGAIARLRDGDMVSSMPEAGLLEARVDTATWAQRQPARPALAPNRSGHGRELFGLMRAAVGSAEEGACACSRRAEMDAPQYDLIADIGGTNARFALTDPREARLPLLQQQSLRCAEFGSLQHAAEHYLAAVGARPTRAAIAVACPVTGDAIRLTNRAWSFSRSELAAALGLDTLHVLNDFGAGGLGHPGAGRGRTRDPARRRRGAAARSGERAGSGHGPRRGPAGRRPSPRLARGGDRRRPRQLRAARRRGAASRAGSPHASAAPRTNACSPARAGAHRRGAGRRRGFTHAGRPRRACAIRRTSSEAALAGHDVVARRTLARFCAVLGSVAGDAALIHGARAVMIAGGIVPRFIPFLRTSAFRERFLARAALPPCWRAWPCVVTHPQPGLLGAAMALRAHTEETAP